MPVLIQGDKLSGSVIYEFTVGAPVTAANSSGTDSLTVMKVIGKMLHGTGAQALVGTAGLQEVAAAPAIDEMEASGAPYSLKGRFLLPEQCHSVVPAALQNKLRNNAWFLCLQVYFMFHRYNEYIQQSLFLLG